MTDPNYIELLKLKSKERYTWDEVERARGRLSRMQLSGPTETRRQEAKSRLAIVNGAIDGLKKDEFIEKLVEVAAEHLKRLREGIDGINAVAVGEEAIKDLADETSCEMRDALDRLERRGIVVLKDVRLDDLNPLDDFIANRIREALKVFIGSPRDLYEFLGEDSTCSTTNLYAAGRTKQGYYNARIRRAESRAGSVLAGECLKVFRSEDLRRKYDHALIVSVGEELTSDGTTLSNLLDGCRGANALERHEINGLLGKAEAAGLRRNRVIQYIWSWAQGEGVRVRWPFIMSAQSTTRGSAPGRTRVAPSRRTGTRKPTRATTPGPSRAAPSRRAGASGVRRQPRHRPGPCRAVQRLLGERARVPRTRLEPRRLPGRLRAGARLGPLLLEPFPRVRREPRRPKAVERPRDRGQPPGAQPELQVRRGPLRPGAPGPLPRARHEPRCRRELRRLYGRPPPRDAGAKCSLTGSTSCSSQRAFGTR